MLGKYGETLVVDWGLAKTGKSADPTATDEPPLSPTSGSMPETQAGNSFGTPGYMSPEQADGRLDLLGPPTDVYALGATLYPLLTGRPAFDDKDKEARLEKTRNGDFPPPRQIQPAIPKPLEAICLNAMALKPQDRYPDVKSLATDLKRWLADEPVSAYPEPLPARIARWTRRHRTATTAAAVLLVGLIGFGVAYRREAAYSTKLASANITINDKNTALTKLIADLRESNRRLDLSQQETAKERDQSKAVTNFLVDSFRSPDPERDGRTITIAEVLDRSASELDDRPDLGLATKASILNAIGMSYLGLGLPVKSLEVLISARIFCQRELGPRHSITLASQNNLASAYLSANRLAEAIPLFEAALEAMTAELGPRHPDTITSQSNLAVAYDQAGRPAEALSLYAATLEAASAELGPRHPDTLTSKHNLATAYLSANRLAEAIPLFEAVLEAMTAELGPRHPNTLSSQNNLAFTYDSAGRLTEAMSLYKAIVEAAESLPFRHPNLRGFLNNLARCSRALGRITAAEAIERRIIADGGEVLPLVIDLPNDPFTKP